jgi:hypothetical protein
LAATPGVWSQWYLDDGYLAGPRALLHDMLPVLEAEAAKLGLELNRGKCAVLAPVVAADLPESMFPGIPRVSGSECLPVLGSPVGAAEPCKAWVDSSVLAPLQQALGRLESLGDPRSASLILRQCFSACKLNWIARTAAPTVGRQSSDLAEPMLRSAWSTILGTFCPDACWELSSLPIRLGGAGIMSPGPVADAAAVASWLGACLSADGPPLSTVPAGFTDAVMRLSVQASGLGAPLQEVLSSGGVHLTRQHPLMRQWCDQSAWSEEIYHKRAALFDSATTERLQGLRRAQESPGAGLWLTALPDHQTRFSASEWQLLLRFRVGVPCFVPASRCAGCGGALDVAGDHALCCSHNGVYRRHNHVRDRLFALTEAANWRPEVEVALPGSRLRPADVLLRGCDPRPLAIDVTISHPLRFSASSAVRGGRASAAEEAEIRKIALGKQACQAVGWGFLPFAVDVTGGFGPSARSFCKRLAKQLAMRAGAEVSSCVINVGAQLSLALAKGRGEMLCVATPLPRC